MNLGQINANFRKENLMTEDNNTPTLTTDEKLDLLLKQIAALRSEVFDLAYGNQYSARPLKSAALSIDQPRAERLPVVLKYVAVPESPLCLLCGDNSPIGPGPAFYVEGTTQRLCNECGRDAELGLAELLDLLPFLQKTSSTLSNSLRIVGIEATPAALAHP